MTAPQPITTERWFAAQAVERQWWDHTTEAMVEEGHHWLRGLLDIRPSTVVGRSVTDLGGGPLSMVADPSLPLRRRLVVDPLATMRPSPDPLVERYAMAAEDYDGQQTDEVWGYNVLQHVRDPEAVLAVARRTATRCIRWFEYVNEPQELHHPHTIDGAWLFGQLCCDGWQRRHMVMGSIFHPNAHERHAFLAVVLTR